MKTCMSCKFSKYDPWHYRLACTRKHKPDLKVPDVINGGTKSVRQTPVEEYMLDCEVERAKKFFGCGTRGKHHKPEYPQ